MNPTNRRAAIGILVGCVIVLAAGGACRRDVRLAGRKIPTVTVGPVTHYGMALGRDATPRQVAFVALRAIGDDALASTDEEREVALGKQFDVCAADVIYSKNHTSVSRDEFVYNVVYHWTPTVSHYVHDFETDWDAAKARLVQRPVSTGQGTASTESECEVVMEVNDPNGDPAARVVMVLWMARDNGFWRVLHLGFDHTSRTIVKTARASQSESSATGR